MTYSLIVDPEATTKNESADETLNDEDNLPEKYRGKTAREIVEMHQNSERELGRARNEVGEVRRLADQLLGINTAALQNNPKPAVKKLTTDELLDNPDESVATIARREADARTAGIDERTSRLERNVEMSQFTAKHPDFQEIANSDEFKSWVVDSPYLQKLADQAVKGSYEAADSLFGLYKSVRKQEKEELDEDAQDTPVPKSRPSEARKASTARSGGSTASGVVPRGKANGEILKRADLITLAINNPDEYNRRWPEIEKAYREKRVR